MGCGSFSEAMGASAPKALRSIEIPYAALPKGRLPSSRCIRSARTAPHSTIFPLERFRYSTKTSGDLSDLGECVGDFALIQTASAEGSMIR
jgi:hypothetical protein